MKPTIQRPNKYTFARKTPFPAQGFKPRAFQLASSCMGTTFLKVICISTIDHFAPIGSQCSEGHNRDHNKRYCSVGQHYP